MSERTVIDVSQVVEQQKLGGFLVGLVVISWIITFFDGFDSQAIAFAAPYLSTQYHLDRIMMGNIFSMGLVGALIGGFGFGYLGDRIGRRPAIILATAAFGLLTLAFVFADSYASLLALRLRDGIALGGMLPLSWALNIEYVRNDTVRRRDGHHDRLFGRDRGRRPGREPADPAIRLAIVVRGRWSFITRRGARARINIAGVRSLSREQGVAAAARGGSATSPDWESGPGGRPIRRCR